VDTIPAVLDAAAARDPDGVALLDPVTGMRVTVGQLRDAAFRAAAVLVAGGLPERGRVALWGPNSVDWAVANLAVLVAGATVVPLNTRAPSAEAAAICTRARVHAVVAAREFLGRGLAAEASSFAADVGPDARVRVLGEELAAAGTDATGEVGAAVSAEVAARATAVGPDDISHVQFTSGTTGAPKGVMLRHGAMVTTTRSWVAVVGLAPGDVYPVVSPCSHIAGHKTGLLACLVAGATAVPLATFDASALARLVDEEGVSFLQGVPTVFHDLVELAQARGRGFPGVRTAVTGAAVIPPSLIRDLREVAGITNVLAGYGLTESTGVVTITGPADPVDAVATTTGYPVPGVELRLVDATGRDVAVGGRGEVLVGGPSLMAGYLDDPEATADAVRDGWLHTGDVGELDGAGRLRIVDRLKDMVVVGGFNVFPAEVEHVLVDHPAVVQAAVVGEPDARLGEVPVAHVVVRAPVDDEELLAFCRARLAGYKVPRRVQVHDALPVNTAGKVVKGALRA
jgi:acyl-CoA synthetase (AMP-forming)/AMP-acid ligase II